MISRADVLSNARLAGEVERYHTWPTHRRQSNGEHTWQVIRIYWQIWGAIPPHITTYLLWHDAAELVTGDLPYPIKANNLSLKAELKGIEKDALVRLGITAFPVLSPVEGVRVKCCDYLDMLEFGYNEIVMGNQFAQPIVDDITRALVALTRDFEKDDYDRVWEYVVTARNRVGVSACTL